MVTTNAVISGLVGGLVATIVMTIVMMIAGDDSPPPTAVLWSKYVGDGAPDEYMMPGMVLHLVYGIVAGAVFAALVPTLGLAAGLPMVVVWGLVYGLVLTVVGAVFWMNVVLGMRPEPTDVGMFAALHLIYGGVLGAWLGAGIL